MKNTDNKTHNKIEQSIADIDWAFYQKRQFTPSPAAWEDHVLYFMLLDRFSDGKEKGFLDNNGNPVATGATLQFQFDRDAYKADRAQWAAQGEEKGPDPFSSFSLLGGRGRHFKSSEPESQSLTPRATSPSS